MFVKGQELNAALSKLDAHYSALPEEVKSTGLYRFAATPPADTLFLVTRLWDKHLPKWRRLNAEHKELTPELQQALIERAKRIQGESQPGNPAERLPVGEANYLQMERSIMWKKGK